MLGLPLNALQPAAGSLPVVQFVGRPAWKATLQQQVLPRFQRLRRGGRRSLQDSKAWQLLPDGRFRGRLRSGVTVEFQGELVGPEDPGVVIGPQGIRYVLGEAEKRREDPAELPEVTALQSSGLWQVAAAAVAAVAAYLVLPGIMQASPLASFTSTSAPVTRTNVTIVETKKTLPDGSTAKISERTVRRERNVPGKAPVVTERTTRTEKEIELSCKLGELSITVRGPAELAANFIKDITKRELPSSSSPLRRPPSEGSFDLVSEPGPSARSRSVLETRDQIAASFAECPPYLQKEGAKLVGSATPGSERAKRAWLAGQWASAVVSGRIHSPNRSTQLDLRPRYYVVLSATGLAKPTIFKSARSYWSVVGELSTSSSVSHAFPSEQEAKIYLAGAGVVDYDTQQ
eukprot:s334_g5.t2